MGTITTKVRNLIQDNSTSTSDIFTYSTSLIFTLSESNPIAITRVYINNVLTTNYTFSSVTKKITLTGSLTAGDTIQIDYTAYLNYSDTELEGFISSALYYLGIHNYEDYEIESGNQIYPTPTNQEEKLIAVIAGLLIEPNNKTIRLPDISITVPNDDPTEKKIEKTIASFKRNGKLGIFTVI
jgi:hypothetical protein